MVRLKKRAYIRVELPGGVVITASPIGAADIDLARQAARRRLGAAADAAAGLARYGIAAPDIEAGAEAVAVALYGVPESVLAIELGIRHIVSWEGVETEAGEPASPKDAGFVAMLFNEWLPAAGALTDARNYGHAWLREMLKHTTLEPGAGKGSAASPDTSTAEAAKTAGNVEASAKPAQTGDA